MRETFFQECGDLLGVMFDGLRAFENGDPAPATVNAVFRAVHSIKGGAGAFGLDALMQAAHRIESVLDGIRANRIALGPGLVRQLVRAGDLLEDLVDAASANRSMPDIFGTGVLETLEAIVGQPQDDAEIPFVPVPMTFEIGPERPPQTFRIRFRPDRTLYDNGNDPALLFRELSGLGRLAVTLDSSDLPGLRDLDWQQNYLSWTLSLTTDVDEAAVRAAFEFVEGQCRIDIDLIEDGADPDVWPQQAGGPDGQTRSGAEALNCNPTRPARALVSEDRNPDGPGSRASIRVDPERVDRLIYLAGELAIRQTMLAETIELTGMVRGGSPIGMRLDDVARLLRRLQETVLAIRAQPIKPLFDRMHRILRDCSDAVGKPAALTISGETTELDKAVIDRLADPLTHMIRNAIDHGLEPADERRRAGKPAEGHLHLSAEHRGGQVIVSLRDDGGGIDTAGVHRTAIEKGMVAPDAQFSESQAHALLLLPGFSTARKATSISGRGVGLDVVRTEIERMQGRLTIQSSSGEGTTFTITLPLTLAVLDGMIVTVGTEALVIPLSAIVEFLPKGPGAVRSLGVAGEAIAVRGEILPIVDLGSWLGLRAPLTDLDAAIIVVIDAAPDIRIALIVDQVQDQRTVVIKNIRGNCGDVPGIAAATILGNGRVALILDTNALAGPVTVPNVRTAR